MDQLASTKEFAPLRTVAKTDPLRANEASKSHNCVPLIIQIKIEMFFIESVL